MSSSVSSPSTSSPNNRGRGLRRWVVVVAVVLSTLTLFAVVRMQGHVTGQEFSPTHFRLRDFSFYEIPLIHIQITPIKRTAVTSRTAAHLRQKALIPKPPAAPSWHLVWLSRGLTGSTPADAHLLVDQLNLKVNGADYWRQWSIDHPNRAKQLWPVIQRLAERELYILMPGLLELALTDQPPAAFTQAADQWLRDEYVKLVKDMHEAEREELAAGLLDEALTDYPEDPELTKLANTLRAEAS